MVLTDKNDSSGDAQCDPALQLMFDARHGLQGLAEDEPSVLPGFIEGLPSDLFALVSQAIQQHGWMSLRPGFDLLLLDIDGSQILDEGGNVFIVRMAPGVEPAPHRHIGNEYNLVLEGAMRAGGHIRVRGDLVHNAPGTVHAPCPIDDSGCVALTVLTGPVEILEDSDAPQSVH